MTSIDARGEDSWRIRVYAGRESGAGKKRYAAETFHGDGERPSDALGSSKPRWSRRLCGTPKDEP